MSKLKQFKVNFTDGTSLIMKARNSNLAYGLARKETGVMPSGVELYEGGNKLINTVAAIGFVCVVLGSCAVLMGGA